MKTSNTAAVTLIISTYNQIDFLPICLKWLKEVHGIKNIILVDNGSSDGTDQWLARSGYDHILFNEGSQGYGTVWNAVLSNFDQEDVIVFMEPHYFPAPDCILRLADCLEETCGLACAMSNTLKAPGYLQMDSINDLLLLENDCKDAETTVYNSLGTDKGFWALSKKLLQTHSVFSETLVHSQNVLLDYTLKLVRSGFTPAVCRQAFVYNADPQRLTNDFERQYEMHDRNILKSSWKMNYFNLMPSFLLSALIEKSDTPLRILEVGCDLGATLLEIKNGHPDSRLFGIEINKAAAEIAGHIANVTVGNIEDKKLPFEGEFDYILFGDVLEHLHDPQDVIRFCRGKLSEHGCIIANVPNIMHISVMEQLLHGKFEYTDSGLLDRTHIHFFTRTEIVDLFESEGFTIEHIIPRFTSLTAAQENLLANLMQLSTDVTPDMYQAFHYTIKATK